MTQKVMIVTGEASGDLHGANLVKAMLQEQPDILFSGMGGSSLKELGVEILFDAAKVSVVGVFEVLSHLGDIITAQKVLRTHLAKDRPDLLIIIDLPDFNLLLAKKAKKLGIPVFYYICPQIWAWRQGRVKTLKKRIDSLGVILPFEEKFYSQHGLKTTYVGHPLLDSVRTSLSKEQFLSKYQLKAEQQTKYIGLIPGSRKKEVRMLLPIFLEAAAELKRQSKQPLVFLVPKASTITDEDLIEAGIPEYEDILDLHVIEEDRYDLMKVCDCAVAASGTVTLELALLEVPMVVTYKFAPLTYQLGKLLVSIDFFSLVNLIAGYSAVPELLQHEVTPKRVCKELALLLYSFTARKKMKTALCSVNSKLGTPGASKRAATAAFKLLPQRG
jgi:lipid-A-disaccharide synthase